MSTATPSTVEVVDVFTLAQARRVAVMLDIDPQQLSIGDPVPRGWHFAMLAGETPRHSLRSDGFPGLGVVMPQLDHPRLLLGQRNTTFQGDIRVGATVQRQSSIASITEKTGRNGPLSIVRVEHSLSGDGGPLDGCGSVLESQVYFLTGLPSPESISGEAKPKASNPTPVLDGLTKVVTPDDLLLFQYSALGFNTHRIHFDRDYATRIEGHPNLVVNGGLATLLATEFLRTDLGKILKTLSARHLAPLYVNRPLTILALELTESGARINLIDGDGTVAAELVMTFDDL
jgi:3-methylfumaryl-CoA hydratase